jgi:integrase
MATIRKRGNGYQIDYFDPSGKRVRQSFKKKKDAEAELGKRVSLKAEGRYLDVKKECVTTLSDLIKKYEENFGNQRSFGNWKKLCLGNFKAYFGADTIIANIRYVDLETYRNKLKQSITRKNTIRTIASVNREMSCFHHLLQKGVEWEMLEQSPFDRGKSMQEKENNARIRYLNHQEIVQLLNACSPHLRNIVICALNTGMRRGEILGLKWNQINNGFIYLRETKTNESRQVPINETLAALFKKLREQRGFGSEYVFTFSRKDKKKKDAQGNLINVIQNEPGDRINSVKVSFSAGVRRANIHDLRFHDLRHTFASHFVMRGGSLKDLQEILGHKTMTMTLRYSHLSQDHKMKAINLLNGLTSVGDMSQNVTNDAEDEKRGQASNA